MSVCPDLKKTELKELRTSCEELVHFRYKKNVYKFVKKLLKTNFLHQNNGNLQNFQFAKTLARNSIKIIKTEIFDSVKSNKKKTIFIHEGIEKNADTVVLLKSLENMKFT